MFEYYSKISADDLIDELIDRAKRNLVETDFLVEELFRTERYNNDFEFRATVETAKALILSRKGKNEEVINFVPKLIEINIKLKLNRLLSLDLNLMAISYQLMGLHERALEYYYAVINNEKKNNFIWLTGLVYNNIATIYTNIGDYKKSNEYLELAKISIERQGIKNELYLIREFVLECSILINKCFSNDLDGITTLMEKIESFDDEIKIKEQIVYKNVKMYYYFANGEYDKAKQMFLEEKPNEENDKTNGMRNISNYIELCKLRGLPMSYYEVALNMIEVAVKSDNPEVNVGSYTHLVDYYRKKDDKEALARISEKYIGFLEDDIRTFKEKQKDSIYIVEKKLKEEEHEENDEYSSSELRLVVDEAIRNKEALQKAYNRISMINEIGRQLMASLSLREVINLVYKNLSENVSVNSFVLMVAEPENKKLVSLFRCHDGVIKPNIEVEFSKKNSLFVHCYENREIITEKSEFFRNLIYTNNYIGIGKTDEKSVIFMPIIVGDRVIGSFTIQAREENAYDDKDMEFLIAFTPYLAIALSNAIYSKNLKKEIERHIETQTSLKLANERLERMAGLDALTQISNRWDFEDKYTKMLQTADKMRSSVCVIMFDIDDFKLYNDNYGHFYGDEVLKRVAEIINNNVISNTGIAARFGGEEFISACIGLDVKGSKKLAETILREVYELNIENKKSFHKKLTVSIGVAVSTNDNVKKKSLLMRQADVMLYQSKRTGKNKVCIDVVKDE